VQSFSLYIILSSVLSSDLCFFLDLDTTREWTLVVPRCLQRQCLCGTRRTAIRWCLICLFVEQFHISSDLFHPCFGLFCPVFPMSVIGAFFLICVFSSSVLSSNLCFFLIWIQQESELLWYLDAFRDNVSTELGVPWLAATREWTLATATAPGFNPSSSPLSWLL
jgi:hypothetical protein